MYEFRLAYRHRNGDVEGIRGIGFNAENAYNDAMNQINRKLAGFQVPDTFEPKSVILDNKELTDAERAGVESDWGCKTRY